MLYRFIAARRIAPGPFRSVAVLAVCFALAGLGRAQDTPPSVSGAPSLGGVNPLAEPSIRSYLSGQVTVNPVIDSTGNFEDFEVLVARQVGDVIDTLGYAVTDRSGAFEMDVEAPRRGVYALIIKRLGNVLHTGEIAVAQNDSARFRTELPLGSRPIRVVSYENSAWIAYVNTELQHNQTLMTLLQDTAYTADQLQIAMERTAGLYWNLRETYPGTMGASVAGIKSVTMLDGWNDSLVVARSRLLEPDTPGYVDAIRAARRAQARLAGQEAALALVRDAVERSKEEAPRAALEATIVQAYLDSANGEAAAEAARRLSETYANSIWATWARRAEYEATTLMPGMPAPSFRAITRDDEMVEFDGLRGRYVVLEFWEPRAQTYPQNLDAMLELKRELGDGLAWISFVMEPDLDLIDAFFEGRALPGITYVQAPQTYSNAVARLYNVNGVPVRYLIDDQGRIVAKYTAETIETLSSDLRAAFGLEATP